MIQRIPYVLILAASLAFGAPYQVAAQTRAPVSAEPGAQPSTKAFSQARPKAKAKAKASAQPVAPVVLNRSPSDVYAATLAGRFAQSTDDPDLAARAWSRAFLARQSDAQIFERAVTSGLEAGDVAGTLRLIKIARPELHTNEAALALAIDHLSQSRWQDAVRTLSGRLFSPNMSVIADHVRAWALTGQAQNSAQMVEAVNAVNRATGVRGLDRAADYSKAMVLDAAGRNEEAKLVYESAFDGGFVPTSGVRAYADFLRRTSSGNSSPDNAASVALYQRLTGNAGFSRAFAAADLAALQAGRWPSSSSTQSRAANALLSLAEGLVAAGRGGSQVGIFALILHLDPQSDVAKIALADELSRQGREKAGEPYLRAVADTSPDFIDARTRLVWSVYETSPQDAVVLARQTATLADSPVSRRLLADLLAATKADREAEALYTRLIEDAQKAGQQPAQMWGLYFGRGGARERLGDWPSAEADLRLAKEGAPRQASVLNYLGYGLADRGLKVEEALTLLREAVRLRPRSGSIVDSLGWALYKAGRYDEAMETLEKAASLSPDIAEIADHLGDVYWRTGREDEARLEWRRALTLKPTDQQVQSIQVKLENGLPPDPARAAERALAAQDAVGPKPRPAARP